MAEAALSDAQTILDLAPLTFTYEDKTFTVELAELAEWLTFFDEGPPAARVAQVSLDEAAVRASLDTIAADINIPVKEGRFSLDIVDDEVKLTQFEEGQDGLGVELDKTVAAIDTALLEDTSNTVALVVEVTHPRATPDSLEDLGIKELLGTGETNFAGSPANRIGNIRRGADLLNGLLVAPGETFSLLSILKPFDAANGWLPELVIKGNKLEKELGGGLCQVGSTAFRAAMMSGQEIVERRNHSWAVSYYNYNGKAGVDATIYDPAPDFKFKNTTDHYILWRTRIEGYNIYFELWGTSDGRSGYFTEPVNYGYTSPGPTEEVVDESLAPGTRNCAQHAYTGVSASCDYIIGWPDGTQTTENFTSVYKAQPARCLVGPEAEEATTEETVAEEAADSTDDIVTEDTTAEDTSTNTNKSKKKNKGN
jgi:vancomycin resistance protein YoaR